MIFDLIFLILGTFLTFIIGLFPTWNIWPQTILDGITYIFSIMAKLNFFIPIDTAYICIAFFINFIGYFITYLIIKKVFNWIRGAQGI